MAAQWFYQDEGQHSAPVDSWALRRLAEAGIIRPDTLVRKGASGRCEQVRGLFQRSTPATSPWPPPGPPPVMCRSTNAKQEQLVGEAMRNPPLPPPVPPPVPASGAPTRAISGKSPIRHGLIWPVTWVAIIVGSGTVLLLLWALVFRGGSTPQRQAEKDQPPLAVARSSESGSQTPEQPGPQPSQDIWTPPPGAIPVNAETQDAVKQPSPAPPTGDGKILELADLAELVGPSVVQVDVTGPEEAGTGSGFVLDKQGTIVTNFHVIEDATAGTWHTGTARWLWRLMQSMRAASERAR